MYFSLFTSSQQEYIIYNVHPNIRTLPSLTMDRTALELLAGSLFLVHVLFHTLMHEDVHIISLLTESLQPDTQGDDTEFSMPPSLVSTATLISKKTHTHTHTNISSPCTCTLASAVMQPEFCCSHLTWIMRSLYCFGSQVVEQSLSALAFDDINGILMHL